MQHWIAAKKVLRYIQRTKDFRLIYRRSDQLELIRYSGIDFAGCVDTKKPTSGYIFMMVGGVVSWKSMKQSTIALSTMEAEFIAFHEASNQALWLQSLFLGLRVLEHVLKPRRIFCNNSAAISFSSNNKNSSRSKHIDIKYLIVKDKVQNHHVYVEFISTKQMIADPLTKGLLIMPF
ncbi:secreted RxLR effector protein 161-like [Magnolia sinica]|uniref:secreted RxLR effector protein 161-like n=1 Tax=Magnolia sinica TaxID=86752 RepID=UPI0026594F09|nr:secreted RxLR effector protein 161-like [Magnolia sinica]